MDTFHLTEEHIELARHINFCQGYDAPMIDRVCVYGNPSIGENIIDILGWTDLPYLDLIKLAHGCNLGDEEDADVSELQSKLNDLKSKAMSLSGEMWIALSIICQCNSQPGMYVRDDDQDFWRLEGGADYV